MNKSDPPRLIHDPRFAEVLEEMRTEQLSPARLTRNAAAIEQRITGIHADGATAAGQSFVTAVKLAIPVGLAAAGAIYALVSTEVPPPPTEPPAPAPMGVADAAAWPDVGATLSDAAAPDAAITAHRIAPRRDIRRAPDATLVAPDASVEAQTSSLLTEQIRRFEQVRALAGQGAYDLALEHLDELERRFPGGPLAAEAALSRADYLVRAGRDAQAIDVLAELIKDPRHTGRRGELLRLLGDLEAKRGACDRAITHYRRALTMDLPDRERQAALRGINACGSR